MVLKSSNYDYIKSYVRDLGMNIISPYYIVLYTWALGKGGCNANLCPWPPNVIVEPG